MSCVFEYRVQSKIQKGSCFMDNVFFNVSNPITENAVRIQFTGHRPISPAQGRRSVNLPNFEVLAFKSV